MNSNISSSNGGTGINNNMQQNMMIYESGDNRLIGEAAVKSTPEFK